jgi:hypothetical protein
MITARDVVAGFIFAGLVSAGNYGGYLISIAWSQRTDAVVRCAVQSTEGLQCDTDSDCVFKVRQYIDRCIGR